MVQQSVSWSINWCHGHSIGVMVHQLVSWSILQSLVVSLVLSHLDYVTSLQQVSRRTNSTSSPVSDQRRGPTWRFHHITPLLLQLHQLRTPEWIQYKLAVLAFRCCNALTWPMKYCSLRTSRLNPAYDLRGRETLDWRHQAMGWNIRRRVCSARKGQKRVESLAVRVSDLRSSVMRMDLGKIRQGNLNKKLRNY